MHTPDASTHDPDPDYLRGLIKRAGMSASAAARRIGVSLRSMRYYLAPCDADHRAAPYHVQFALEALAREGK